MCSLLITAFCFGKTADQFLELQAAKNDLFLAKNHLENSKRDFGGHRAKAADAVDKAIKEINDAILYGDKR